jgi:uncharacterized membrane protein HdeD (DUF308 family)
MSTIRSTSTFPWRMPIFVPNGGWFVALLVLGFLALGNLLVATLASVFFVGIMIIAGAVAQAIHAFQVKGWGGFFFLLLGGLLCGVTGIMTFANPALAALVLTLFPAAALVASGVLRVWAGIRLRPPPAGGGWWRPASASP